MATMTANERKALRTALALVNEADARRVTARVSGLMADGAGYQRAEQQAWEEILLQDMR